jgi:hypothetical protein
MSDGPAKADRAATVSRRLRVGVVLDSTAPPAWVARVMEDVAAASCCELRHVLIVKPAADSPGAMPGRGKRHKLFEWYEQWDRRRNACDPDALAGVEVGRLLDDRVVVDASHVGDDLRARLCAVKAANLDVLLLLCHAPVEVSAARLARYGIWSLHHGDAGHQSGPPGFWECYDRNPRTGSTLLSEHADSGRTVIYRSWSQTDFGSLHRSRNPLYWKAAAFPGRCLRKLHDRGSIESATEKEVDAGPPSRGRGMPGSLAMVAFLARLLADFAWVKARSFAVTRRTQWFVALRPRRPEAPWSNQGTGFHVLKPPPDRYYGDPCVFERNGVTYLFLEDYRFDREKGLIGYVRLDAEGRPLGEIRIVLERPYHMSYPFVFEWQGQIFLIPETRSNRAVELYRAAEFPDHWVLDTVLMRNVEAVDATVYPHSGRLWMFLNIAGRGYTANEELHLFHATSPRGPWRPHPANPVVSDVSSSRSAGALFLEGGRLVRPAQDCALRYGHAIAFREVLVLSESEYRERQLGRLGPEWSAGNRGTHTYSRTRAIEAIDGHTQLARWKSPRELWETVARRVRALP